ncbi:MAG TPA: hypothetical protein VF899_11235 [Pyrinomonadaceae bacterium]
MIDQSFRIGFTFSRLEMNCRVRMVCAPKSNSKMKYGEWSGTAKGALPDLLMQLGRRSDYRTQRGSDGCRHSRSVDGTEIDNLDHPSVAPCRSSTRPMMSAIASDIAPMARNDLC